MNEHLLFLQAAGSDFDRAHDLVAAVTEAVRAGHAARHHEPGTAFGRKRLRLDPEQIAERVERAGYASPESLLVALATHATIASPLNDVDTSWVASTAARIGDTDLLLETAGVIFAFNAINRIADARRVRLEYRLLRELKPIRGWVERRLASLTGVAYDLSYKHRARHSPAELLDRLSAVFACLGAPTVPEVFHWLSQSPVVLEGIVEMLEACVRHAGVRFDLLKEAMAIAVASRAMPSAGLHRAVDHWLCQESLPDSDTLRTWAAGPGDAADSDLVSTCRRYAWQVANAAYTITDDQIAQMTALGLSDAELLDITLATALFTALAIIEPIGAAVAAGEEARHRTQRYAAVPQLEPIPQFAALTTSYSDAH